MHPDRIGDFIHHFAGSGGITFIAVIVNIFKIPAKHHNARSEGVQFAHERNIVAIAGDQSYDIEFFENIQFQCFQRETYIHTFFTAAGHRQIMRHHTFPHENIIKHALIQQDLTGIRLHCGKTPAEIVTINDLTEFRFHSLESSGKTLDEIMKSGNTETGTAFMCIAIVIADMIKIITVIKNSNSQQV